MTSLSAYLRMERVDVTEEVTFYAPGATSWHDLRLRALRAMRAEALPDDPLYPSPIFEPEEAEEV